MLLEQELVNILQAVEIIGIPKAEAVIDCDLIKSTEDGKQDIHRHSFRLYLALGRVRYDRIKDNQIVYSGIVQFDKRVLRVLDVKKNTCNEVQFGPKLTLRQHVTKGEHTINGVTVAQHEAVTEIAGKAIALQWSITADGIPTHVKASLATPDKNIPNGVSAMAWKAAKIDRHRIGRDVFEIPVSYAYAKVDLSKPQEVRIGRHVIPLDAGGDAGKTKPKKSEPAPVFNVGNLMKNTTLKSGRVRT